MTSQDALEGSCLCQAARYRVTGTIRGFQYCHCSRCRKFTGSGHAANLFVDPMDLEWIAGDDLVGGYTLASEPPFPTAFCTRCGSSLPFMSSTGRFWVVPAGTLDGEPELKPTRSIFWGSRAGWFCETGELPKHETLPPETLPPETLPPEA